MVRIRKNASKLLGSDYLIYPPLPLPPAESWGPHSSSSSTTATATAEEEGEGEGEGGEVVLCRLNCSPWDVIGTDLEHLSCCFQEERGDEGRGIMGNGLKFEEYEEILATFEAITSYCSSNAAAAAAEEEIDLKSKYDDDKKVKKRRKRKRKEEENGSNESNDHDSKNVNVVAKSGVVVVCSKNDGKGWHCKRPANPQHTLCDHHLDLLRNYSSRTNGSVHRESHDDSETDDQPQVKTQRSSKSAADESAGDGVSVKSHRPKAVAAASKTAGDGYYYYYSGFGPWRGKKRSSGGTTSSRAAVDNDDDDKKVEGKKDDSGDDGPVAGDDLDDDMDDDDDDVENKGRIVKKKGRKRVKARSLKSLM